MGGASAGRALCQERRSWVRGAGFVITLAAWVGSLPPAAWTCSVGESRPLMEEGTTVFSDVSPPVEQQR